MENEIKNKLVVSINIEGGYELRKGSKSNFKKSKEGESELLKKILEYAEVQVSPREKNALLKSYLIGRGMKFYPKKSCKEVDLSYCEMLTYCKFDEINWQNARFIESDLTETSWDSAILKGVDFRGAKGLTAELLGEAKSLKNAQLDDWGLYSRAINRIDNNKKKSRVSERKRRREEKLKSNDASYLSEEVAAESERCPTVLIINSNELVQVKDGVRLRVGRRRTNKKNNSQIIFNNFMPNSNPRVEQTGKKIKAKEINSGGKYTTKHLTIKKGDNKMSRKSRKTKKDTSKKGASKEALSFDAAQDVARPSETQLKLMLWRQCESDREILVRFSGRSETYPYSYRDGCALMLLNSLEHLRYDDRAVTEEHAIISKDTAIRIRHKENHERVFAAYPYSFPYFKDLFLSDIDKIKPEGGSSAWSQPPTLLVLPILAEVWYLLRVEINYDDTRNEAQINILWDSPYRDDPLKDCTEYKLYIEKALLEGIKRLLPRGFKLNKKREVKYLRDAEYGEFRDYRGMPAAVLYESGPAVFEKMGAYLNTNFKNADLIHSECADKGSAWHSKQLARVRVEHREKLLKRLVKVTRGEDHKLVDSEDYTLYESGFTSFKSFYEDQLADCTKPRKVKKGIIQEKAKKQYSGLPLKQAAIISWMLPGRDLYHLDRLNETLKRFALDKLELDIKRLPFVNFASFAAYYKSMQALNKTDEVDRLREIFLDSTKAMSVLDSKDADDFLGFLSIDDKSMNERVFKIIRKWIEEEDNLDVSVYTLESACDYLRQSSASEPSNYILVKTALKLSNRLSDILETEGKKGAGDVASLRALRALNAVMDTILYRTTVIKTDISASEETYKQLLESLESFLKNLIAKEKKNPAALPYHFFYIMQLLQSIESIDVSLTVEEKKGHIKAGLIAIKDFIIHNAEAYAALFTGATAFVGGATALIGSCAAIGAYGAGAAALPAAILAFGAGCTTAAVSAGAFLVKMNDVKNDAESIYEHLIYERQANTLNWFEQASRYVSRIQVEDEDWKKLKEKLEKTKIKTKTKVPGREAEKLIREWKDLAAMQAIHYLTTLACTARVSGDFARFIKDVFTQLYRSHDNDSGKAVRDFILANVIELRKQNYAAFPRKLKAKNYRFLALDEDKIPREVMTKTVKKREAKAARLAKKAAKDSKLSRKEAIKAKLATFETRFNKTMKYYVTLGELEGELIRNLRSRSKLGLDIVHFKKSVFDSTLASNWEAKFEEDKYILKYYRNLFSIAPRPDDEALQGNIKRYQKDMASDGRYGAYIGKLTSGSVPPGLSHWGYLCLQLIIMRLAVEPKVKKQQAKALISVGAKNVEEKIGELNRGLKLEWKTTNMTKEKLENITETINETRIPGVEVIPLTVDKEGGSTTVDEDNVAGKFVIKETGSKSTTKSPKSSVGAEGDKEPQEEKREVKKEKAPVRSSRRGPRVKELRLFKAADEFIPNEKDKAELTGTRYEKYSNSIFSYNKGDRFSIKLFPGDELPKNEWIKARKGESEEEKGLVLSSYMKLCK